MKNFIESTWKVVCDLFDSLRSESTPAFAVFALDVMLIGYVGIRLADVVMT